MSSTQPERIYDDLLARRIVFLRQPLDAATANLVIAQLLHLAQLDPAQEISLHVNCEDGDLHAALAVYDTMQSVGPRVRTTCVGSAGGGAVLLLAGGAAGKRAATPTARIHLAEAHEKISGKAAEVDVRARSLVRLQHQVNEILARHTGQPVDRIEADTERGLWLSAEEARAYGLIDEIVGSRG